MSHLHHRAMHCSTYCMHTVPVQVHHRAMHYSTYCMHTVPVQVHHRAMHYSTYCMHTVPVQVSLHSPEGVQMSTPVKRKKRRISASQVDRLSIIPRLEKSFSYPDDDDFVVRYAMTSSSHTHTHTHTPHCVHVRDRESKFICSPSTACVCTSWYRYLRMGMWPRRPSKMRSLYWKTSQSHSLVGGLYIC